MSVSSLSATNSITAAYGSTPRSDFEVANNISSFSRSELSDLASSRNPSEALSKLIDKIPFMYQAKGTIATALNNAHAPFLVPLRVLNSASNYNLFRMLPPGIPDKGYEVLSNGLLRFLPVGKLMSKLGVGNSLSEKLSNTIISGMKKANIKMDEAPVREFVNELVSSLNKIYDPKFLRENVDKHFFTRALTHGSRPYEELTDVLIQNALDKAGEKMVEALNQGMGALKSGVVQESMKEAVGETAKNAKENISQTAKNAKGAAQNAVNNAKGAVTNTAKNAKNLAATAAKTTAQTTTNTKQLALNTIEDKTKNNEEQGGLVKSITGAFSSIAKIPASLFKSQPKAA